jgi:hypothetical protein
MISNGDSIQSNGHPAVITLAENGLSRIHVEENIMSRHNSMPNLAGTFEKYHG